MLAAIAGAAGGSPERVCGRPLPPAPGISVPDGFRAEIYAAGLNKPTAMAYGPDGRLYVAEHTSGKIVATGPGSCRPKQLLRGFETPLGLAWVGNRLYVSSEGRVDSVLVLRGVARDPHDVLKGLPFGRHQQDNIALGPDGRLYLGNGSTCDACAERDRRSATILSFRPGGSDLRIVARGLRNPYGLAFRPGTRDLYASVNGQDELGTKDDPEPAETIVRVRHGADYGWPRCWPSARLLELVGKCDGVTPPAAYLEPHSSADGIAFYTGKTFPAEYRGDLFVAEWGQYLEKRFGRRVVRVELAPDGRDSKVTVFASGFDHPLAVAVDRQGALLVADYGRGLVYRIQSLGRP
jgi:glucose/arabinose dehydrogenase